jgi:hypothetical protein
MISKVDAEAVSGGRAVVEFAAVAVLLLLLLLPVAVVADFLSGAGGIIYVDRTMHNPIVRVCIGRAR